MKRMTLGIFATLAIAILSTVEAVAAPIFTVDVNVVLSGNVYRYEYTITNDISSTFALTDFSLDLSTTADLQSIALPTDWLAAYTPGDIIFYAYSSEVSTDISPGSSRVISFESLLAPEDRDYSVFALDTATQDFEILYGSALSPALPVPEPSSAVLIVIGLALNAICLRRALGQRCR